jgi:predicted ATP-dependent endonuclease of OLD family
MEIDVKFSGYRCFSSQNPATLRLREGLLALIGVNNSGKSTLMRAIYELRDVFSKTSQDTQEFIDALKNDASYTLPAEIGDPSEIFWHFAKEDALIEVSLPTVRDEVPVTAFWRMTIRLRHSSRLRFALILHDLDGNPISSVTSISAQQHLLQ